MARQSRKTEWKQVETTGEKRKLELSTRTLGAYRSERHIHADENPRWEQRALLITIDQPSGVTREYEIRVNSLITQAHGILATNEPPDGPNRAQSYPAFPLSFSKSLPSDSSADSIRGPVKSWRCNNDGQGFGEVDGRPTSVALTCDPRPVRHGSVGAGWRLR